MDQKLSFPILNPATLLKRFLHFIQHCAFRISKHHHHTSTGLHINIGTPMEDKIYHDIFEDHDYDKAILYILTQHRSTSHTILDLGSNTGLFIFRLIHLSREKAFSGQLTIHGIEANSKLCEIAINEFAVNHIPKEKFDITLTSGLIGQKKGEGVIHLFKDHGLSSRFRKEGKAKTVRYVDITSILHSAREIDLIKCDIEGSEEDFIKNYEELLQTTNAAVFEFHLEFIDYNNCITLIQRAGLRHREIIRSSPFSIIEFFHR